MFVHIEELKEHVRITFDDYEFDSELRRLMQSAENQVLSFLNRNVFTELPAEPEPNDIVINESIKLAILDLAGYYFDNKGNLDEKMTTAILRSTVGHLRLES